MSYVCVCACYVSTRDVVIYYTWAGARRYLNILNVQQFNYVRFRIRLIRYSPPPACLVRVYILYIITLFIIFIYLTRFKSPDRLSTYMYRFIYRSDIGNFMFFGDIGRIIRYL